MKRLILPALMLLAATASAAVSDDETMAAVNSGRGKFGVMFRGGYDAGSNTTLDTNYYFKSDEHHMWVDGAMLIPIENASSFLLGGSITASDYGKYTNGTIYGLRIGVIFWK